MFFGGMGCLKAMNLKIMNFELHQQNGELASLRLLIRQGRSKARKFMDSVSHVFKSVEALVLS